MVQILDVMEKALTGIPLSENDYQLRRFAPKVQEKVREFRIKYDPETPVSNDNSLADDLFDAGLELLVDVGAYCMDSGRVISYTESEVRTALRNAPDRLEMGEGMDRKSFTPRKIGDQTKPWCLLGAGGGAVSCDEAFATLMEGYAEIPEVDAVTTPALTRAGGMRIRPRSPLEVLGAMRSAMLGREACSRAGRQGIPFMNTLSTAESAIALAAAMHPKYGLRPSDGFMIASMDPMKIDFDRLNKVTVALSMGAPIGMDFAPLMGGYSGGPEGTAVTTVASHMMGLLTLQTSYLIPFPLHLKYVEQQQGHALDHKRDGPGDQQEHPPAQPEPELYGCGSGHAHGPSGDLCFCDFGSGVRALYRVSRCGAEQIRGQDVACRTEDIWRGGARCCGDQAARGK